MESLLTGERNYDECTAEPVLIVDDNEMNRDMLARRLARKGYVIGCRNAQDFAATCQTRRRGSVLLDIEMPDISGLDA